VRYIDRLVKELGHSVDVGVVEAKLTKLVVLLDERELILFVVEDKQLLLCKILDGFYSLFYPSVRAGVDLVDLEFGVDYRLITVPGELGVGSIPEALRLVDAVDRDCDGVLDLGINKEDRIFCGLSSVQIVLDR
jgi:hypothetical protein